MLPLVRDIAETPQVVLPKHRHRALQLLMAQVKGRASQSQVATYVRELELAIHSDAMGRDAYMRILRAMAFNMRQNGRHLMETHAPESLVQLDHVLLAKGTPVETWHTLHMERQAKEQELQASKPIDFFEGEDDPSLIRCSRCRSTEVTWEQKQTRGADESMTVFFTCTKCNKRWKMC